MLRQGANEEKLAENHELLGYFCNNASSFAAWDLQEKSHETFIIQLTVRQL